MSKKPSLVILGKGPVVGKDSLDARDDWPGFEVWTVGTHRIENAGRYYEFHGLEFRGHKMVHEVCPEVDRMSDELPINNSISAMLLEAYFEGYTDITLAGCPMSIQAEYIEQKPALAMCVGWLRAKGTRVVWLDEMPHGLYYKEHRNGQGRN